MVDVENQATADPASHPKVRYSDAGDDLTPNAGIDLEDADGGQHLKIGPSVDGLF